MRMNDTVYRIVEIMFQDVEMNDEVAAIRDEVMNNCQERYYDLVGAGMSEDDAVAAVIESLKGMEDIIAPYKRRTARVESHPDDGEAPLHGDQDVTFAHHAVQRIDLVLISEDVTIEASDDDQYHVRWNSDADPQIRVALEDDTLRIERDNTKTPREGKHRIHIDSRDGGKGHIFIDGEEMDFGDVERGIDSISSMLEDLGRSLGRMFSSARSAFSSDGVTICIPAEARPHVKLRTTSGDFNIDDVALADLTICTVSGDVEIDLREEQRVDWVDIRSTSGDIEITLFTGKAVINTTSGDMETEGRYDELSVGTVSGDIDVRADVGNVSFKAVSGDVDLAFDSDEIRSVNGSTISGDVDIDLPSGIGTIAISTKTRSGDITTRYATNSFGPAVGGSVSTMSGDITIR